MKRLAALLVLLLMFAANAHAAGLFWKSARTGGSAAALDAISVTDSRPASAPGTPLGTGDTAIILGGAHVYFYTYDAASILAESDPAVIKPDNAGATGRWLRIPAFLLPADIQGLAVVATSGSYADLSNKPTIPTDNANLLNGAGYITGDTETDPLFAAWDKSTGISITESQISDLTHTVDTDTHLSEVQVDAYVANNGYLTSFTELDPTVNTLGKASMSCTEGQVAKMVAGTWTCAADSGTDLSTSTTTDLAEGTNLYYTDTRVSANTDVAANTAARHSHVNQANLDVIDQDLSTTSSPTFAGVTINGADGDRALSLLDNTAAVACLAGDYRLYPQNGVWKRCENGVVTDVGAGATSGDMLKSTYDNDANNQIDDGAIPATIARDSELNTFDPGSPGAIGETTPSTGNFTDVTADSITAPVFNLGTPPAGTTGEISIPEDPANGANVVGFKAPASIAADQLWVLPATDGSSGQALVTDGSGNLAWSTPASSSSAYVPVPTTPTTACTAGQYAWDTTTHYDYHCEATNTWKYRDANGVWVDWVGTYTDITYWWGCEALTLSSNDYPTGTAMDINAEAVISATQFKVGTNSCSSPTSLDNFWTAITTDDLVNSSVGRVGFWIYLNAMPDSGASLWQALATNPTDRFLITMSNAGELSFVWTSSSGTDNTISTTTASLTTATWYFVEGIWDQPNTTLKLNIDGVELASDTSTAFAALGTSLTYLQIGEVESISNNTFIDNVMISSDPTRDFCGLSGGVCVGLADDSVSPR